MEEKKNDQTVEETSTKKENNFIQGLKKIKDATVSTASKTVNKIKDEYNKLMTSVEFKKEFDKVYDSKAHEFTIESTEKKFKGIKHSSQDFILILNEDLSKIKSLKSSDVLVRSKSQRKYVVLEIEDKEDDIILLIVDGKEIKCPASKIMVKDYIESISPTVVNTITNQSVHVSGTVHGNVQQISDVTVKLDKFEKELRNAKVSIFNKGKHEEIVKIYGDVKDSIINGKKDQTLFDKFCKLLGSFNLELLNHFTSIF